MGPRRNRRGTRGALIALLSLGVVVAGCDTALGIDGITIGCVEGEKQCAENTLKTCNAAGSWDEQTCADQTCDTIQLECVGECAPGKRCAGNTLQTCDAVGEWSSGLPCEEGTFCNGGLCAVDACSVGDLRCAGDFPQECDSNGKWQSNGPVCPVCVECNPDMAACGEEAPEPVCAEPMAIALGDFHTCALLPRGSVKCWGHNVAGQLGLEDTEDRGAGPGEMGANLPPVDLGPGVVATTIAVGDFHTCALLSDGSVKCWGYNYDGQLGLEDTEDRGDGPGEMGADLPTVDLGPGVVATAIAPGRLHTCALLSDGSVKCWGYNGSGGLGLGDTEGRGDNLGEMGANLPTVDLGPGVIATAIAAGWHSTCALLSVGNVKCWGNNHWGHLGLGDEHHRGDGPGEMGAYLPKVDLGQDVTATAIAAGADHACALLSSGSVKCWGHNGYGQLGLGDENFRGDDPGEMGANLPTVDLGLDVTATAITLGYAHTCALLLGGSVKCWGNSLNGELGLGTLIPRGGAPGEMGGNLPPVDFGPGVAATVIAGDNHTCVLLFGGSLKCWGRNSEGQLGFGDPFHRGTAPGEMGDKLPTVDL